MKTEDGYVVLTKEELKVLMDKSPEVKPKKLKLCTSKKILITVWSITILLVAVSVYGFVFTDKDITPVVTLAGIMAGAAGADTALYSWKAKAENKIKLTFSMVRGLAKDYGIESVVQLASIVLSD